MKINRFKIVLTVVGALLIVIYNICGLIPGVKRAVYTNVVHPLHLHLATLCDYAPFAVGEILIAIAVFAFFIYVGWIVIRIIKKDQVIFRLISILSTIVMIFLLVYGGFCVLWGVYYDAPDLKELCGIESNGIKHSELIKVDEYFIELTNEYARLVERNSLGDYCGDEKRIYDHATVLYDSISKEYPGLLSSPHKPKRIICSGIMSYMDFSGFFFPFTAEACINANEPLAFAPGSIAHELAHQRGIAAEDECNFVGILACIKDQDTDYVYSASLLAMIHLQNALYKSGDVEEWRRLQDLISPEVKQDLREHNEYWSKYRKSAAYKMSSNTYDAFLKSYNQSDGIETYGACVDLLVEYFKEIC